MEKLTRNDLLQISIKGMWSHQIHGQYKNFEKGFKPVNLVDFATINNGIIKLSEQELNNYIDIFEGESKNFSLLKFVPASGAASRMFSELINFSNDASACIEQYPSTEAFIKNIEKFAFYNDLQLSLDKANLSIGTLIANKDYKTIVDYILYDKGLNYCNLPKALILFHKYENTNHTALEEHLIKGVGYLKNEKNEVHLHFTISPEHKILFTAELCRIVPKLEAEFGIKYFISFSEQKETTEMIALNSEGNILRNELGNIVFRPGGHGALIENLNECDSDIIFIKNIDNVTTLNRRKLSFSYKKALAAILIEVQKTSFEHLNTLYNKCQLSDEDFKQIEDFAYNKLNIRFDNNYSTLNYYGRIKFLTTKLNRPIRVCGMVKNDGEPGGGPFWVKNSQGDISLQIIEASQINKEENKQAAILANATHFNPVDLVCGTKDFKGKKFDLKEFIDPETGFISDKTQNGEQIKIQELPGLWNGAMANWNTIFVEVPAETFTPVKVVCDLLRAEHQVN